MKHTNVIKELIYSFKPDIDKYQKGEKSDYLYEEEILEKYGSHDKNYVNRMRLCYGLIYHISEIINRETVIRELFEEELKSRRNESFQGIGTNIELLTIMMGEYESYDSEIFQQVKNANFDCFCGYDPKSYEFIPIENYSLYECISIAAEFNATEYVCVLLDELKTHQMDIYELKKLKYYSQHSNRPEDRELAVTEIFKYTLQHGNANNYEKMSAYRDYIELLIDNENFDEAVRRFLESSSLYSVYKRSGYELGAKLIPLCSECRELIWNIVLPLIISDFKRIAPVNCIPLSECAEIMGDKQLSKKLMKLYHIKMKDIRAC